MRPATKTALFAALSSVLALGAAEAYAGDDNVLVSQTGTSATWHYTKTAVTPDAALATARVIRTEDAPELVVPLVVDTPITATQAPDLSSTQLYSRDADMRQFDITTGDDAVFIGSNGVSEFDTLDAQRNRAGYTRNLGVDPLTPVAGAGLATSF